MNITIEDLESALAWLKQRVEQKERDADPILAEVIVKRVYPKADYVPARKNDGQEGVMIIKEWRNDGMSELGFGKTANEAWIDAKQKLNTKS